MKKSNETKNTTTTATENSNEKQRLMKECISMGLDVFSIMLQADVNEATNTNEATTNEAKTTTTKRTTKEKKSTTTTKTEVDRLNFKDTMHYIETAYNNGHDNDNDTTTAIINLATATALSVVKKCRDSGIHATHGESNANYFNLMNNLYFAILRDKRVKRGTALYLAEMYTSHYNENGDKVQDLKAGYNEATAKELVNYTLSDGFDLVSIAILAIFEEIEKQVNNGLEVNFERRYNKRETDKRVYIQSTESAKFTDKETCAISEIFKAVRRGIQETASFKMACNGFSYTEATATDTETGKRETVYKRLPRYSNLATLSTCGNVYTADTATDTQTEALITKMKLSAQQTTILKLRLSGYGYKAIASYLGVKRDTIRKQIERIQGKAVAIGIA